MDARHLFDHLEQIAAEHGAINHAHIDWATLSPPARAELVTEFYQRAVARRTAIWLRFAMRDDFNRAEAEVTGFPLDFVEWIHDHDEIRTRPKLLASRLDRTPSLKARRRRAAERGET